jgi:hypothetical protein
MKQGSEQAASYLEARRQRRLGVVPDNNEPEENDEPADSSAQVAFTPPPSPSFFNSDPFWFTLSGITLGIAISIVGAIIKQAIKKP